MLSSVLVCCPLSTLTSQFSWALATLAMATCHSHTYATSKVAVTDPQAIQELLSALKGTFVYWYAEDFCRVSSSIIAFTSNDRICETTIAVSRHLVGGEFQPPAAHLPSQADSLLYQCST